MKHKIYSLLLILFIVFASSSMVINANAAEAKQVTIKKTIKVNKTIKTRKLLKLNKSQIKSYSFTTSNPKVASVSKKGIVKGLKKGSAVIRVKSKKDNSVYATINVTVKNRYTKSELRLLSSLIYCEAGAECYAGKKAVGIVVMNRVHSNSFPNTLSKVVYQPGQFGPTRNGSLNRALSLYDNGKLNKDCIKAAKETLNGETYVTYKKKTINMSSYLFFSGYVSGCRLQIQNHQFK